MNWRRSGSRQSRATVIITKTRRRKDAKMQSRTCADMQRNIARSLSPLRHEGTKTLRHHDGRSETSLSRGKLLSLEDHPAQPFLQDRHIEVHDQRYARSG